jgi:hypothetical protein
MMQVCLLIICLKIVNSGVPMIRLYSTVNYHICFQVTVKLVYRFRFENIRNGVVFLECKRMA